jgi:hypothetical protein
MQRMNPNNLDYSDLALQKSDTYKPFYTLVGTIAVFVITLLVASKLTGSFGTGATFGAIVFVGGAITTGLLLMKLERLRRQQLHAFAAANQATFIENIDNPGQPGLIFQEGDDRHIKDCLTIQGVEVGTAKFTTGSGKNRQTHEYGYLRMKLPRKLPHMVLDATANNYFGRFSTLPTNFDRSQKLSLEGNFDSYFTLYAPKAYERDALYVFTPDVMHIFVEQAYNYDVEIIDDNLYLYSNRPFDIANATQLKGLLNLAAAINPEMQSQTDYYYDERVASRAMNVVSEPGRRLNRGFGWLSFLVFILVVTINLLDGISDFGPGALFIVVPILVLAVLIFVITKILIARRRY